MIIKVEDDLEQQNEYPLMIIRVEDDLEHQNGYHIKMHPNGSTHKMEIAQETLPEAKLMHRWSQSMRKWRCKGKAISMEICITSHQSKLLALKNVFA